MPEEKPNPMPGQPVPPGTKMGKLKKVMNVIGRGAKIGGDITADFSPAIGKAIAKGGAALDHATDDDPST